MGKRRVQFCICRFPVLKWTENFARQERGGGILLKCKVAVVECREYRQELVDEAVRKVVGLLGGWERFVGKEERILLKPNLLANVRRKRRVQPIPRCSPPRGEHSEKRDIRTFSSAIRRETI